MSVLKSSICGAVLLGAAASLPLHLLPFLIWSLISSGSLSVAQSGAVVAVFMLGQLATTLGLPMFGVRSIQRSGAVISVVVILLFILFSSLSTLVIHLSWCGIGVACGVLQFLAATSVATAENKKTAYGLRLAVSLSLGGVVIVLMSSVGVFVSYQVFAGTLMGLVSLTAVFGLCLYRMPILANFSSGDTKGILKAFDGLLVIFLLFAGQVGFYAYLMHAGQSRDMRAEDLLWAIAVCKLFAAGVLYFWIIGRVDTHNSFDLFIFGAMLGIGGLLILSAANLTVFLMGFFLWEVSLNVLSARFQATIAEISPLTAGPWMAGAIFLGSAVGPLLNGLARNFNLQNQFEIFAVMTALAPWVWIRTRNARRDQR